MSTYKNKIFLIFLIFGSITIISITRAEPNIKWSLTTGGAVYSSPLYDNGTIYIGSDDFNLYSLDAETGKINWQFKTGDVNWSLKIQNDSWSSPCFSNGTIYIGLASYSNRADSLTGGGILAISADNGIKKWKIDCGTSPFIGGVVSSPTVYNDVGIYGSLDGKIYCVKSR